MRDMAGGGRGGAMVAGFIAGLVAVRNLFASHSPRGWTALFIATAALTIARDFGFTAPFGPSHVVGIISLVLFAGSTLALYVFPCCGPVAVAVCDRPNARPI